MMLQNNLARQKGKVLLPMVYYRTTQIPIKPICLKYISIWISLAFIQTIPLLFSMSYRDPIWDIHVILPADEKRHSG